MNNSDNVRVRFAPSPTGFLHIGGLRTALFNYLFARHNNGKFILRIEDTDQTRQLEGALESLINTLKTLGLNYDEGPDVGGDFGPYIQSRRLEIYQKYSSQLIEKGSAYYCFCTSERLEEIRKHQQSQGLQTQYDRFCRNLLASEVKQKLNENKPHVIRLKVPLETEIKFHDIIRGTVKFESNHIDDQVLLKSDGYPTYHLANVIDDHLMKITHIIRGEEWLTSVPKHILLYHALGWNVPEFAHVPLILNSDKTKLSKRQGDVATEDFLRKGYLPETLLNFIALLGWNPGDGENREIFSKEELIKLFTLEKVHSSGAVFNIEKLNWMNNEYIKNYDLESLTAQAVPFLHDAGFDTSDTGKARRVIETTRPYLKKLDDVRVHARIYYIDKFQLSSEQLELVKSELSRKVLSLLVAKVEKLAEIPSDNFKPLLTEIQIETGIKGKNLYQPIRLALTGEDHGPELGLIAYVLGKNETLHRLKSLLI